MAADVLGVISAGLGIISFILGQTPSNSQTQTSVELTVGYAQNPDTMAQEDSPDGNFGHVYLFSPTNSQIGDKDIGGHHVGAGVSYQFKVDTTGEQPQYLEVTATNKAVCMSWMAVTYGSNVADGTYAWFGDYFQYCGLEGYEWYYGGVSAGREKDSGDLYTPKCAWLDADHTNNHKYASLKARMTAFKRDEGQTRDYICRPPVLEFGTDTNIINKREHARDVKAPASLRKRGGTRGDNSLVTSSIPSHSATELCESPNSSGPDFVSLEEGLYCDMTTREIRPICNLQNLLTEDCFNLDVVEKTLSGVLDGSVVDKAFSRVVEWAPN